MSKHNLISTHLRKEKAFLVGVSFHNKPSFFPVNESLRELSLLANTAGLEVVGQTSQKLDKPNPSTFIGSGKVGEIRAIVEELDIDIVVFDEELSPRHLRELEEKFGLNVRVIDRTALILDIFALHASTAEGKLQVELAQYEYLLPRLTRAWTHLARQAGGGAGRTGGVGGVGLRGPGETQLEVDRRQIRNKIIFLQDEIEKIRLHRKQYRQMRKKSHIPIIALVGYTNAGKSTLLNRLTRSNVYIANQLFATLDPTTRRYDLLNDNIILLTDTVGFIQKLPTQLIASFRATLEEINEADLLIHIVDITHPAAVLQWTSVNNTLSEIHAENIPMITVLNKSDRKNEYSTDNSNLPEFSKAISISALQGYGINDLLNSLREELFETYVPLEVYLPYGQGQLISTFHQSGQIEIIEHGINEVLIKGSLPGRLISRFQPFIKKKKR